MRSRLALCVTLAMAAACGRTEPLQPPAEGHPPPNVPLTKLLFAVDRSASMAADDPQGSVVTAIADRLNSLPSDTGLFVGALTFGGEASTPVEVRNLTAISEMTSLDSARFVQSLLTWRGGTAAESRSFVSAFDAIHDVISRDGALGSYQVFFISDGVPRSGEVAELLPELGGKAITRVVELGDVKVDAIHVFDASPPIQPACELTTPRGVSTACDAVNDSARLLQGMARAGGGAFFDYRNGTPVTSL